MISKTMKMPRTLYGEATGIAPGLLLSIVIAAAATFVSDHYGGPKFLYALLLGISLHFLSDHEKCGAGIEFAAKKLVRIGVALLGVRIAFSDVSTIGLDGVGILAGAVVLTIMFSLLFAKLLKVSGTFGLLAGGATGICGISAAMAISSTIPQSKENEQYTLMTAIGVAAFSTIAMVLYPFVVTSLQLSPNEAGMFLGGSIHDVAQVVGAGFMLSTEIGDASTLAKMFRVAMLMPVILLIALSFRAQRKNDGQESHINAPIIPFFLMMFIALIVINSFNLVPPTVSEGMSEISKWCLVISIAALGIKTSFEKLFSLGWKPIILLLLNAMFIAVYMLTVIYIQRIV
ncbi:putative sulfate exporter family transporter [Vibrio natriegens]|uniref:YeiH family protein n=1 Tax=Vibrio natriegens TaxID=691 RepID=UPI0021E92B27|nr:putative sulfate exporter family transporter [Vibrio natriegens]UYI49398.1 putative sulfate exporter family transporter [Vibrio natriegens]